MIQASIYAPSGRQRITSAGLVSTRSVTILAPSFILFRICLTGLLILFFRWLLAHAVFRCIHLYGRQAYAERFLATLKTGL